MTHSACGYLYAIGKFPGYNKRLANKIAADLMFGFGRYQVDYDSKSKITTYSRKASGHPDGVQPFIDILDESLRMSDWKGFKGTKELSLESMYLMSTIRSGSHVGLHDTELVQEIFDSTLSLLGSLNQEFQGVQLSALFDDEHNIYLPATFKELIRKHV